MTTTEDAVALCERLRRKVHLFPARGGGSIGTDENGKVTSSSYVTDDGLRLANPDGPEAADAITALQEKVRRLEIALTKCRELFTEIRNDWTDPRSECREGWAIIEAALNGSPDQ